MKLYKPNCKADSALRIKT
uniref:Uncharacterized protein n=1 Tax=Arundo donax TaxID=35708 RepID=A0A0A8YK36_ARUDO